MPSKVNTKTDKWTLCHWGPPKRTEPTLGLWTTTVSLDRKIPRKVFKRGPMN